MLVSNKFAYTDELIIMSAHNISLLKVFDDSLRKHK